MSVGIAAHTATRLNTAVADETIEALRALTGLHGIRDVIAAKILARSGTVTRFRSESAFASYCGVAPIEVPAGDV